MFTERVILALLAAASAVFASTPATGQLRFIDKLKDISEAARQNDAAPAAPAPMVTQPTALSLNAIATQTAFSNNDAALSLTFNVTLGDPPIAVARDTTCENVAATNPGDLLKNVLTANKGKIIGLITAIRDDRDTTSQRSDVMESAKLELKRQVWLPLAIEKAVGQRILEQRAAQVIAEDDPAAADLYANVKPVFDSLRQSTQGLQPYDLTLVVVATDDTQPNAETLPGGIVVVNEALAQADTERIYGYLSHELGHVTKRHQTMALQAKLIDSVQGANALNDLRELTNLSGQALLDRILGVIDLTAALFTRYYTAQELEADACGAKYLAATPENDASKSIDAFLGDVEQNEKGTDAAAETATSLVEEQHPSYAERRRTLTESYVYWSRPH